jgi:hypothetical protein
MLIRTCVTCAFHTPFSFPLSATFDFEEQISYSLSLQVVDGSSVDPRRSEISPVLVSIGNVDDEPTVFNQTEYSESIRNPGTFGTCRIANDLATVMLLSCSLFHSLSNSRRHSRNHSIWECIRHRQRWPWYHHIWVVRPELSNEPRWGFVETFRSTLGL